jgi:hypothetical protein
VAATEKGMENRWAPTAKEPKDALSAGISPIGGTIRHTWRFGRESRSTVTALMSLSWESDARGHGVFGTERGNGRERVFRAVDGSGLGVGGWRRHRFQVSHRRAVSTVTKAGVAVKYQAKGFMVAIMKGLMMVGEWNDVGSVRL